MYTPQPGTIPARVVHYLQVQVKAGREWVPQAELADHVGQAQVAPYIKVAVSEGALRRRPMALDKRLSEYSLGDGTPTARPHDLQRDEPLHPTPQAVVVAAPVAKPSASFRAGLFTDGTLLVNVGKSTFMRDAKQVTQIAGLLRGYGERSA